MPSIIKNKILELKEQGFKRKKSQDKEGELSNIYIMKKTNIRKTIIADKTNETIKVETKDYTSPLRIKGYPTDIIVEDKTMTKEEVKTQKIMNEYKHVVFKEPKLEKY